MDAVKQERAYTVADIYALPDGERAELIDGQIFYMAPPGTRHQRLLNYINTEINLFIRHNSGECEVFPAPFGVFLSDDDRSYVEPDISVVCDRRKITEKGCHGAPDWVIEIVSPGSRSRDYMTKLFTYRTAGVRDYWIVDPEREMITVYAFEMGAVEHYRFGEAVPVRIYEGFSITV